MKIRTSIPVWNSLREVALGVSDLMKGITAGWNVNHNPDGTHAFPWTTIPFAPELFTASGSMTWTVTSPSVTTLRYVRVGNSYTLSWFIASTTLNGTGSTAMYINLPNVVVAGATIIVPCVITDSGAARTVGYAQATKGESRVSIRIITGGNWTATGSLNTSTYGQITFEVEA